MSYLFNIIDQPWILCIRHDQRTQVLSLREALAQANRLTGLSGDSPLETAAIHRLLLAILHSALRGPRDHRQWGELWKRGSWDVSWLHGYLDRWTSRFDLFDSQHPFYQANDPRMQPKSISNLIIDMVAGNQAVLFDHHTDEDSHSISFQKAVRSLVTVQSFGLAGLCNPKLQLTFTDAPWARGIVFLVEGDTLFETLALNLLLYNTDQDRPIPVYGEDLPAWEQDDPYLPDRDIPFGYLDYLTWQNRKVMLYPDSDGNASVTQMAVLPGLRLTDLFVKELQYLDPMKCFRKNDRLGLYSVLRFQEDKALWRDSSVILNLASTNENRSPLNFHWISQLISFHSYLEVQRRFRFMALGMANDQAKVEFFREEHLQLPATYLTAPDLVGELASALENGEQTFRNLRTAGLRLALIIIDPSSDDENWQKVSQISKDQAMQLFSHWGIERYYWRNLELPYQQLIEDIPKDYIAARLAWVETLKRTAWDALEQAADLAGGDPLALKAAVRARSSLGWLLNEQYKNFAN